MRMEVKALSAISVAPTGARVRPAWLPLVAALCFCALTAWLGVWQLHRAEEKRERQSALDAAAALPALELGGATLIQPYRRVRVSGRFDERFRIYLDNRVHQGRPGYHVIVPLAHAGGSVLVNRGWLPAAADRSFAPHARSIEGPVSIEGVLVPARERYFQLDTGDDGGPVWQNLDLNRFRAWYRSGGELPDYLLQQMTTLDDGLVRDWPRPDAGVQRHLGYATQWFAVCAAIVALYAYYGVWRRLRAPR